MRMRDSRLILPPLTSRLRCNLLVFSAGRGLETSLERGILSLSFPLPLGGRWREAPEGGPPLGKTPFTVRFAHGAPPYMQGGAWNPNSFRSPGLIWFRSESRPVSRVLSLCGDLSKRPTRRVRGPHHPLPIRPCSERGLPPNALPRIGVSSYLTFSPLPRQAEAVFFLLHFPSNRFAPDFPSGRSALWSPDFPLRHLPEPPPGRLSTSTITQKGGQGCPMTAFNPRRIEA